MENATRPKPSDYKHQPSYQRHRRQMFWQILLPIILVGLLMAGVIALVILTATGSDPLGQVSTWADTSLIWLILPALLFAFVILAILGGLIYLLAKLLNIIPGYTSVVQDFFKRVSQIVGNIADKIASPFIAVKSVSAATNKFFERLQSFFRRS